MLMMRLWRLSTNKKVAEGGVEATSPDMRLFTMVLHGDEEILTP